MLPTALVPVADVPFYRWQAVVQLAHMLTHNYPTRYLFYTGTAGPSPELRAIMATVREEQNSGADVHVTAWNDWRRNPRYDPAMKPGLVGQWMSTDDADVDAPWLLLDPDAFPLPSFIRYARQGAVDPSPERWFGTDTDVYTGPRYLKSKGEDLWRQLCSLAGVDPATAQEFPGRGSQWVFTGAPARLWEEIASLSEQAYPILTAHRSDVQTWCAEMYMTQLVLVREGITQDTRAAMRMIWASDSGRAWQRRPGFFHNAGVVKPGTGHFHKGSFADRAPFFVEDLAVSDTSASARFVGMLHAAEERFPDLCRLLAHR